jgi:hypothetical protein
MAEETVAEKRATHTPGPWFIKRNPVTLAICTADQRYITENVRALPNQDANAFLIVAAPEMYDALKTIERHCPCGARPETPRTHPHVGGCPVGDALARAEGR